MPFCPKCKSLIIPKAGKLVCAKCGTDAGRAESRTVTVAREEKDMLVWDSADREKYEVMPKMKAECPKCGNQEAYYRTQQTRKSDEPETTFLRCAKCDHRWRKY